jgi:hypothetical protein
MQSYQSNSDDPSEDEPFEENLFPVPARDSGSEPTEEFPPYEEDELPPLPPRPAYRYQQSTYEPAPASKVAPYEAEPDEPRSARNSLTFGIAKFNQFLTWLLWVIEVMFALRFFLKLLGAEHGPFIDLLYGVSTPLLAPFAAGLGTQTARVEWETLLAMIVYFLVILALIRFLRLFITDPEL